VTALTIGVTTAKFPECKRGVATNIAAALARHSAVSGRVCLVDADPLSLDVTTRLAVSGPVLEDFAGTRLPAVSRLARVASPPMSVLPSAGGAIPRVHLATERALPVLGESFDVVVCDVPGGPTGPGLAVGQRLERLDWLVVAMTPEVEAVTATEHFVDMFETAKDRGHVGDVRLALVCTGDESSSALAVPEIEERFDVAIASHIPQLWGRSVPNHGFGPALAIPELDEAVYDLFMSFRLGLGHRASLVTL